MLFLATVEAEIHSRHPEEPAGTHGGVIYARPNVKLRADAVGMQQEMIRKSETHTLRNAGCDRAWKLACIDVRSIAAAAQ